LRAKRAIQSEAIRFIAAMTLSEKEETSRKVLPKAAEKESLCFLLCSDTEKNETRVQAKMRESLVADEA